MKSPVLAPVLALVLLVLTLGAASAAAKDAPDLATRTRDLVKPYLEAQLFAGAAVGVVKDGTQQVFGYGEVVKGLPRTPDRDTLYEIGSITKVFTGILLADLVQEGKVRLDQPVRELLPDGVVVPKRGEREITLVDLATHTSGLPRMPSNFAPTDKDNPYADYDADRLYAWLKEVKLDREPGTKSLYSNVGMGLLGHALARADGTTYEAMLKTRILDVLGMTSTTITLTDEHRRHLAPGYTADLVPASNWDLAVFAGAGAIRSTGKDMLRFVEACLATEGPLRESLDLAMTIHHKPTEAGPRLGLAWLTGKDGKGRWHNGQTGGYHSFCRLDRERKTGVVVLTNTATMQVDRLGTSILKMLNGEKVETPSFRKVVPVESEILDEYPGTYRLAPTVALVITRDRDRLHLQATGQPQVTLHAAGDDVFFLRIVKAEVHFVRSEAGAVTGLVLHQNGREIPGKREE